MDKKIVVVVVVVVIIAVMTIFNNPSDTIIPLPEPEYLNNNDSKKGVQTIVDNLDAPWAIDISRDDRIFFTEREGKVRVINQGKMLEEPLVYINTDQIGSSSGLLGLALDPDFINNNLIYIFYTYIDNNNLFGKVLSLKEKDNKIIDSKIIIDKIPASLYNNGGRIEFGPDNKLYISIGDATRPDLAQNMSSLAGKILRINPDGTIPEDNPFMNSPVYSYGHRNVQGMAWDPDTKQMYAAEQGHGGFDEINLILAGKNYGWPDSKCKSNKDTLSENALFCFNPAIAPGGIVFSKSDFLGYKNDLILTTLKGTHLRQIDLDSKEQNNILVGYGRLVDIVESNNGELYILTSNTDGSGIIQKNDDKILKITSP
ncbi:MAG: PQQ-dependent sugar dehydrogenase [Nitrososphaeraceae archaeon]